MCPAADRRTRFVVGEGDTVERSGTSTLGVLCPPFRPPWRAMIRAVRGTFTDGRSVMRRDEVIAPYARDRNLFTFTVSGR